MRKTYLLFAVLLLSVFSGLANAETSAVKASIKAIDEFYNETQNLTKDLADTPKIKELLASSIEQKNATIRNLEDLNRTEKPGQKRFERAYGAAAAYMDGRIEALKTVSMAEPANKARIDEIIKNLIAIKTEKLNAVEDTKKFERTDEKIIKPVPSVDKSPYENSPENGGKGIWER